MGMYDSVNIEFECPYCHETSEMEFQTKDLDCELHIYVPGDSIKDTDFGDQLKYLGARGQCMSKKCREIADKVWIMWQGSPSGFGTLFDCKIRVDDDSIITDDVYDISLGEEYNEEYVNKHKDKWEGIYKQRGV